MTWTPRKMGKKGGKARAEKLSPERRREIAKQGGDARAQKSGGCTCPDPACRCRCPGCLERRALPLLGDEEAAIMPQKAADSFYEGKRFERKQEERIERDPD